MKKFYKNISQKGSIMIEALAMLGLITMVTPILYKKAAERTTELQDINTAMQMRTISKALDDFISDNYDVLKDKANDAPFEINKADLAEYLPHNFNIDESKLFTSYDLRGYNRKVQTGDNSHSVITGLVVAKTSDEKSLPMLRASKIASMIGANGGIVREGAIKGVQGGWEMTSESMNVADVPNGSIAVTSINPIANAGISGMATTLEGALYRVAMSDPQLNTMQTTLSMGGHDLEMVSKVIAKDDGTIDVQGGFNVLGDYTTTDGNITTTNGSVNAASAAITNELTAGSATIADALKTGTAKVVTNMQIGGGDAAINTTEALNVAGSVNLHDGDVKINSGTNKGLTITTADGKVVADGRFNANSGAVVKGDSGVTDTAFGDGTKYAMSTTGNLLVDGNVHITNDMKIDNKLIASSLYGDTAIGGGKLADGSYNFNANSSEVSIQGNKFTVGTNIASNDVGVEVSGGDSSISTLNTGVTVSSPTMVKLENGANSFLMQDNAIKAKVGAASAIDMLDNSIGIKSGAVSILGNQGEALVDDSGFTAGYKKSGDYSGGKITLNADSAFLKGAGGVTTPSINLAGGKIKNTGDSLSFNDNFLMDDDKIMFNTGAVDNTTNDGVIVRRNGIIEMNRGEANGADSSIGKSHTSSLIRVDRMLANEAYPKNGGVWGPGTGDFDNRAGVNVSSRYDAYQVNPAYTSVMHDIKLATRGGARLSDILPDFINKGIYVIDNTYKEKTSNKNWENYTVTLNAGGLPTIANSPENCPAGDTTCVASPWLGFVPFPQCPPGYAKVITINPIRWKMSEAYYVTGAAGMTSTNVQQNFEAYFFRETNPLKDPVRIMEADGGKGMHSHQLDPTASFPLTFQTNTWLNTTVAKAKSTGAAEDVGWHAIMGFLYYGIDYKDWLNKVSPGANYDDSVIWNLFPVYNEEMAAIANVYCYFERRSTVSPTWSWDSDYVDTGYDQLTNYRSGFSKNNSGYNSRLNDPVLNYNEVW